MGAKRFPTRRNSLASNPADANYDEVWCNSCGAAAAAPYRRLRCRAACALIPPDFTSSWHEANHTMMDKALPALIVCDPEIGALEVGALSLLDRLVVTLHRAGCRSIQIICKGALPSLKRTEALGIRYHYLESILLCDEPMLLVRCELIVLPADVKEMIKKSGRLTNKVGLLLPIGVVPPETVTTVMDETRRSNSPGAEQGSKARPLDDAFQSCVTIAAEGIALRVQDIDSARRAEQLLWDSLVSDSDGFVDVRFNRPMGRCLSKIIVHTPITPNQVSMTSVLIGLVAAYFFSQGEYASSLLGAVLFQISAIVDCIDGDVARMVFKESRLGKWVDIVGDQVVHIAVFGAIAFGASKGDLDTDAWFLGGSAMLGAFLSFLVVLRGMVLPKDPARARVQQLIEMATSRDFSVLVLVLAGFGKLEWFLWMAAIGVHLFWIAAFLLQLPSGRRAELKRTPPQ